MIDEQLDTIGKAFLGQTIGCARCHDHKFDPISQHDYYAMAGIFASTRTLSNYTDNVVSWFDAKLPMEPEREAIYESAEKAVKECSERLQSKKNQLAKRKDSKSGSRVKGSLPIPLDDVEGIVLDDSTAGVEWKLEALETFPAVLWRWICSR